MAMMLPRQRDRIEVMSEGPPSGFAREIYLRGMSGIRPQLPTDLTALEEYARERVEPEPFWYVAGSAGSGATAQANRAAFDRWQLVPRMLTGASDRDASTTVFGAKLTAPVLTAPVGAQGILH